MAGVLANYSHVHLILVVVKLSHPVEKHTKLDLHSLKTYLYSLYNIVGVSTKKL